VHPKTILFSPELAPLKVMIIDRAVASKPIAGAVAQMADKLVSPRLAAWQNVADARWHA